MRFIVCFLILSFYTSSSFAEVLSCSNLLFKSSAYESRHVFIESFLESALATESQITQAVSLIEKLSEVDVALTIMLVEALKQENVQRGALGYVEFGAEIVEKVLRDFSNNVNLVTSRGHSFDVGSAQNAAALIILARYPHAGLPFVLLNDLYSITPVYNIFLRLEGRVPETLLKSLELLPNNAGDFYAKILDAKIRAEDKISQGLRESYVLKIDEHVLERLLFFSKNSRTKNDQDIRNIVDPIVLKIIAPGVEI